MNSRRWIALVACAACLACAEPRAQVLDLATEKEANEVLVLLDRFGVPGAQKEALTVQRRAVWRVSIDERYSRAARFVLDRLGLPREDRGGLAVFLESGGVIPSATAELSRLLHAKADKLARTLETHDRVVTARVHVVQPERQLAVSSKDGAPPSTASVYLRYLPPPAEEEAEDEAPPIATADVQELVSNSVEGLAKDEVRVVYSRIDLAPARAAGGAPIAHPEVAGLIRAESERLAKLRQLDRPIAWFAAAVTLLAGFLCVLLKRERARARSVAQAEALEA